MNTDDREEILARLRSRLGRVDDGVAAAAGVAAWLAARQAGPRPPAAADLCSRFTEKSLALASTVEPVAQWATAPAAVAGYLRQQGLPQRVVGWPLIGGHDWAAAGIQFEGRGAREGDQVGITGCHSAIAETGTLLLLSGPDTPASVSLLPETHIAILAASRIVADMEEAWRRLRAEHGQPPRALNFISGPSRTADIEQTMVLGAHGPYRVHIVLVTGA